MTECRSKTEKGKKGEYTTTVYNEFPYPYGGTLKEYMGEVQSFLAAHIPEEYHESLRVGVEAEEEYGSTYIESSCWYERPATKEEIVEYKAKEWETEQFWSEQERKDYERLKAKFEASSGKK